MFKHLFDQIFQLVYLDKWKDCENKVRQQKTKNEKQEGNRLAGRLSRFRVLGYIRKLGFLCH
jgi:hypothetical protein